MKTVTNNPNRHMKTVMLGADAVVFRQGDPGDRFWTLVQGKCSLYTEAVPPRVEPDVDANTSVVPTRRPGHGPGHGPGAGHGPGRPPANKTPSTPRL